MLKSIDPGVAATAGLQAIALIGLTVICGVLVFHAVPQDNRELLSFGLGAVAGVLSGSALHQLGKAATASPQTPPAAE